MSAMHERVLRNFLSADGRLHTVPSKQSKLDIVLDHIAQSFEPGRRYSESEVNEILMRVHSDYSMLRRHLVEGEFLTREDAVYWRTGGSVDV